MILPLLLVLWSGLCPQGTPFEAHLRNVHLERRETFLDAWDAADPERREMIREVFRRRRAQGLPAVFQVSAQKLTELTRVLRGEVNSTEELSWATRFACSLDLLVLPGAFSSGGGGEEMIVRVLPAMTRLFEPLPDEVVLRLIWVGPEGQEIPARREPIGRGALRLPGFEMYLRAPASRPGRWWLVPEVEHDGEVGRGALVQVDCVNDLFARAERLEAAGPADPFEAAAHRALDEHLNHGLRDRMAPPIDALLDGELLPPLLELSDSWAGGESLFLDAGPKEPREIVLVVAPALEDPDWVFAGEALEGWIELAVQRRARVYATALPISDPKGEDVLGLLAGLHARYPDLPLTLVLRGPAVGRLVLAHPGSQGALPFDRVVVDTVLSPRARIRRQFDAATLVLTPLAEEAPLVRLGDGDPPLYRRALADPPLVIDRRLGQLVGEWLAALDGREAR